MSYENGKLSRAGMEAAIANKGSVLHKGVVYTDANTLPTEADLADTPEEKAKAATDIDAQIAALQARKATIDDKPAKKSAHKADDGK